MRVRKRDKKLTKGALSLILAAVFVLSLLPMLPVFAAVPNEGEVPVDVNYYLIDTGDMTTAAPGTLDPGQLWTNKDVVHDATEKVFTITYSAWGAPYAGGFMLKEGTGVTFEDVIGMQFDIVDLPDGFSYDTETRTVRYTFEAEEIIGVVPAAVSFDVKLKAGWKPDVWYFTNESAAVYFSPEKRNEYYWMTHEVLEEVFEITGFSWNDGNLLNTITFNERELGIGTFTMERDKAITPAIFGSVIQPVATSGRRDFRPDEVANPRGKWSYYAAASTRPGALKDYYFWFMTPGGDLYEFEADVSNPGGNVGRAGRLFITYSEPVHRRSFEWVTGGDMVKTSLPNKGKLKISYDPDKVFSITYDANGGDPDSVPVDEERYIADGNIKLKSGEPYRRGYRFTGWNSDPDGGGVEYDAGDPDKDTIENITGNVTIYAQWEELPPFIVTYDADGGINAPEDPMSPYFEGETVTVLDKGAMTKPGFRFTGWKSIDDNGETDYAPGDKIPVPEGGGSITLIAQWEPVYTVKYDRNGGSGTTPTDTTQYEEGSDVTVKAPGNISRTGYVFTGWNTVQNPTAENPGITYESGDVFGVPDDVEEYLAVDNSITLYAQWEPFYTVTYNKNWTGSSGSGSAPADSSKYKAGNSVTVLGQGTMNRSGYTFLGWSKDSGAIEPEYTAGGSFDMPASNVTLYAVWQSNTRFRLYYNVNEAFGGTGTPPADAVIYSAGQQATVKSDSAGSMSNGSKIFVGWNTKADGSGKWYYSSDKITMPAENVTLYAQWADAGDIHKVTYHGNGNSGGTAPADNNKYVKGAEVTTKTSGNLVLTGKKFVGWNTTSDGTGDWYYPGDVFGMPDEDMDLYAIWVDISVQTYKVRYNGNGNTGGTAPLDSNDYLKDAEAAVKDSGTLVRSGWTFKGWNTRPDGTGDWVYPGDLIDIAGDVTLYAQWTPLERYKVTYNANGGSGTVPADDGEYSQGDTVTVKDKNTLHRDGHTFLGWNTERDGSGAWYDPMLSDTFEMPDENVVLYAQWDPAIWFRVIYDANGGVNPPEDSEQYSPESSVGVIFNPPPARTGYTFRGWSTDPEVKTPEYTSGGLTSFIIKDDTILYAVWSVNTSGEVIGTPTITTEEEKDDGGDEVDGGETTTEETGEPGGEEGEEDGESGNSGSDNGGERENGGTGNEYQTVVFPDGKSAEDYPQIDFGKRQPNPDVPGGTFRDAPPVPNNPENKLQPQYNDEGELIFIEFDFEDVPLGAWHWDGDEDEGMWTFEDFDVPLGDWDIELPQTGYFNALLWVLPIGAAILGIGILLSNMFKRDTRKSKR